MIDTLIWYILGGIIISNIIMTLYYREEANLLKEDLKLQKSKVQILESRLELTPEDISSRINN